MTDFDDRLRHTLSADDEAFLKDLEDGRGLFAQLGATFQGPMRFWTIMIWAVAFILTGVGFYAVWEIFQADTTRGMLLWMAAGWAAWTAQIAIKQWIFERMSMMTVLRELKKIELRLARMEDRSV